jgi:2-amino-4-hydroxy-6-hydroxymethyldihydropteridine diphosphokinase
MKTAYLSLGSNIGDRAGHIARALKSLSHSCAHIARQSSLYATEPVDFEPQRWFLNCVVEAETSLMPRQLLSALRRIERELGRKQLVARGPRTIDLDILFYGSSIVRTPDLEIPHPRLSERRFVLVPLAEIAPTLRHPVLGMSVTELLAATQDRASVRRWDKNSRL